MTVDDGGWYQRNCTVASSTTHPQHPNRNVASIAACLSRRVRYGLSITALSHRSINESAAV
ncbi:MAG: hypothetical protein FWH33_10250, partial [Oscillospiraceae bacterium]|nr:hypothetical protein [Oscillospiraceae bacterium]